MTAPALPTVPSAPGPVRGRSRCLRHPDRLDLRYPELWITRAQVVLLAATPCVLAISVLLTVVAAVGAAIRFGLVIKSEDAFERFGAIRHVAVDKTGALTHSEPAVAMVLTVDGIAGGQALAWAASLEQRRTQRSPQRSPPPP